MSLRCESALGYSLDELADLFTRSFEGYFVPVQMNSAALAGMLRRDGVDLGASRVLTDDGAAVGLALLARRGWDSRVAAMGITAGMRGKGAGRLLLNTLLKEARQRGERSMELEVIDQNTGAIHLYEACGFRKLRHLVGMQASQPEGGAAAAGLEEVAIRQAVTMLFSEGEKDYPWQLAAETVATFTVPARAFRLEHAWAVLTDPAADTINLWTLLTEKKFRGQGQARRLLSGLMAAYPHKQWHIPAILPADLTQVFAPHGFIVEALGQYQMRQDLQS